MNNILDENTKVDLKFNNFWGILVSVVISTITIVGFYNSLSSKIDLLNQKVDYLTKQVEQYNEKNIDIQTRLGTTEKDIAVIYTRLQLK